jgi:hypothetical protein
MGYGVRAVVGEPWEVVLGNGRYTSAPSVPGSAVPTVCRDQTAGSPASAPGAGDSAQEVGRRVVVGAAGAGDTLGRPAQRAPYSRAVGRQLAPGLLAGLAAVAEAVVVAGAVAVAVVEADATVGAVPASVARLPPDIRTAVGPSGRAGCGRTAALGPDDAETPQVASWSRGNNGRRPTSGLAQHFLCGRSGRCWGTD